MRISAGAPHPLGATWDGRGTNFALFSANAEKVELCLFDSHGRREIERIALPERTEDVWHGYLADVAPGRLYGYRVHGPLSTGARAALQFAQAPDRSLCEAARRPPRLERDAHFGYRAGSARAVSRSTGATTRAACPRVWWSTKPSPGRRTQALDSWQDTIIYEAHVKGLTQLREDVPPAWRGTYRAVTCCRRRRSGLASPPSNCCRSTPLSTTGT